MIYSEENKPCSTTTNPKKIKGLIKRMLYPINCNYNKNDALYI